MQTLRVVRNPRLVRLASSRPPAHDDQTVGALLCDSLQDSQGKNAGGIVQQLDTESQQALLAALLARNKASVDSVADQYVDKLFLEADNKQPDGLLDR